jgi:hypothetical protein
MTAVEWLAEKLKSQGLLIGEPDNLVAVREAKEMEKQQQGYSEEEVKDIVEQTIEKFYKHFYTLTKAEMKEQWFEQVKKK